MDLAVLLVQLQQQTVKPKAIYIADNSGTDEALRIATRYKFDKDIPIAVEKNVGTIHQSWNAGIEFAKGDDVAILNDDIMIPEDFIETFEKAKGCEHSMYCPANDGFPPVKHVRGGYSWKKAAGVVRAEKVIQEKKQTLLPDLKGWCMVIPNKTIQTIGLFDENLKLYFGDTDYEARILKAGGSIAFISGLNVQHFGSSSTQNVEPKKINGWYEHDEKFYKEKWSL
jgi:GT2 family glycosyltransferase